MTKQRPHKRTVRKTGKSFKAGQNMTCIDKSPAFKVGRGPYNPYKTDAYKSLNNVVDFMINIAGQVARKKFGDEPMDMDDTKLVTSAFEDALNIDQGNYDKREEEQARERIYNIMRGK